MKLSALTLIAVLAAGAAHAQGGAPPPQAARDALQKACAADLANLCAGKTGPEAGECMRAAGDKVSAGCRDAMSKMVRPAGAAPDARPASQAIAPAGQGGGWALDVREDWLIGRIHRAQDEHDIDAADAERAYQEVAAMRTFAGRLRERHGGAITAGETVAQEGRLDALIASIHWLSENGTQRPW